MDTSNSNHSATNIDSLLVADEGWMTVSQRLYALIEDDDHWEQATALIRAHPEAVLVPYHKHGWTLLHWLCSRGGTPASLVDLVASLHPEAIQVQDTFISDTALHLVARNCQLNAERLLSVLKYCGGGDDAASTTNPLLVRNRLGGTALHSAANHNAVLPALQALVEKAPGILEVTTHEGIYAVTALWLAYTQTIPGNLLVGRILNGEVIEPGTSPVWPRFWAKVEYLALQVYWHRQSRRSEAQRNNDHVAFGLLQCNVPINLFKVCLRHCPQTALAVDHSNTGNLPLHVLIENRPYRLKEREAIQACLQASRDAAGHANNAGDVPLQIAVRNKIPWHNGVDLLVEACPDTVQQRDSATQLYPFQLAASQGGKQAVETAFHLLRQQPDLLGGGDEQ